VWGWGGGGHYSKDTDILQFIWLFYQPDFMHLLLTNTPNEAWEENEFVKKLLLMAERNHFT
jgi:hypothetical protein